MKIYCFIILFFSLQSCIGWGDSLNAKHITRDYYLIRRESGGKGIAIKDKEYGTYQLRGPSDSWTMAYAIKDSLLILKTQDYKQNIVFTVVNMNLDTPSAPYRNIYVDTIPEGSFKHSWIGDNRFTFISVEEK